MYRQERSPRETLRPRSRTNPHREPVTPISQSSDQVILTTKRYPTYNPDTGFNADDGASLLMAFRGLQAETVEHGQLHEAVSQELHTLVAEPFQAWTGEYKVCPRIPFNQSCDQSWPLGET